MKPLNGRAYLHPWPTVTASPTPSRPEVAALVAAAAERAVVARRSE